MSDKDEMDKQVQKVVQNCTKRFGEGILMRLDDDIKPIDVIPTGCLSLDLALGVGGLPRGRISEIYGPDASGKTTVCLHVIAEAQKQGEWGSFIDMEHALDPQYAQRVGVDLSKLLISQPDTGEQALELLEEMVRSKAFAVIVVDSVAALVPQAEIDGDMGDSPMGMQARLMSQAMRKLSGAVKVSNSVVLFTNQIRNKIGVIFGNPEVTSGGMALKFYASVRLDIRRRTQIKDGNTVLGNSTRVRVVKNKVAPPFRIAEFDIIYGKGISRAGDVLDLGEQLGVLRRSGSWYYYGEERLGQGRENVVRNLNEKPELLEELYQKVKTSASSHTLLNLEDADDGDDDHPF